MKKLIKVFSYILVSLIIILAIVYTINLYQKDRGINMGHEDLVPFGIDINDNEGLFVVSGEYVCLPVKDPAKPHNDLCVHGIKGENDDYYRLKSISDDPSNIVNRLKNGQKIEIDGTFINEQSEEYITLGTIEVKSLRHLDANNYPTDSLPLSFKADFISFSNYISQSHQASEYPHLESWVEHNQIQCDETPLESSLPLRKQKREINGKLYCIVAFSEGAAGSIHTQYSYSTVAGDKIYVINFLARYSNCGNYPEEELAKCHQEREQLNLDKLVDQEIERLKNLK